MRNSGFLFLFLTIRVTEKVCRRVKGVSKSSGDEMSRKFERDLHQYKTHWNHVSGMIKYPTILLSSLVSNYQYPILSL